MSVTDSLPTSVQSHTPRQDLTLPGSNWADSSYVRHCSVCGHFGHKRFHDDPGNGWFNGTLVTGRSHIPDRRHIDHNHPSSEALSRGVIGRMRLTVFRRAGPYGGRVFSGGPDRSSVAADRARSRRDQLVMWAPRSDGGSRMGAAVQPTQFHPFHAFRRKEAVTGRRD